jgi:hypothetical protein
VLPWLVTKQGQLGYIVSRLGNKGDRTALGRELAIQTIQRLHAHGTQLAARGDGGGGGGGDGSSGGGSGGDSAHSSRERRWECSTQRQAEFVEVQLLPVAAAGVDTGASHVGHHPDFSPPRASPRAFVAPLSAHHWRDRGAADSHTLGDGAPSTDPRGARASGTAGTGTWSRPLRHSGTAGAPWAATSPCTPQQSSASVPTSDSVPRADATLRPSRSVVPTAGLAEFSVPADSAFSLEVLVRPAAAGLAARATAVEDGEQCVAGRLQMRWSLLSQHYSTELEDLVEGHFDLQTCPWHQPRWHQPAVAAAARLLHIEPAAWPAPCDTAVGLSGGGGEESPSPRVVGAGVSILCAFHLTEIYLCHTLLQRY